MKHSDERILTTHVGSIVRPQALLRFSAAEKHAPSGDYETALKDHVEEVVRMQAKAGLDIVNDGEFGKSSWANYVLDRLTGFEPRPESKIPARWLGSDRVRFAEFMASEFPRAIHGSPADACVGPITYKDRWSIRRDIENLKTALGSAGAVQTSQGGPILDGN